MIGAPAQGESGELDTLGSDRPDDEADEQRQQRRHLEPRPENRGRERLADGQHLDGGRAVTLTPSEEDRDGEEGDEAVDEQHLAEQSWPGGQHDPAGAEEGGRGIRPRGAEGDRALQRDQGPEEAEHHEDAVRCRNGC